MTTAAFDPRMGAAGDMLLGALVAAGADRAALDPVTTAVELGIDAEEVLEDGISATDVSVGGPSAGEANHRTFDEVVEIVEGMALPDSVEDRAIAAFRLLGEAEAAVHGTELSETHFHEVGADDAIVDVVGTFLLLDDLEVDRIVTTACAVGGGEVETSHGRYPVPAPAVAEIASRSDLRIRGGPVEAELLTPTGAAILGSAAEHVRTLPPLSVVSVGYGAGDRSFDARPNVLRVLVGESTGGLAEEPLAVLETNVDDASPEILGHLQDRMAEAGALDVSTVPLTMKKSRPGHLVRVIAHPADEERLARILAEETGSLGIRAIPGAHRWVADRSVADIDIEVGGQTHTVGVKIARDRDGTIIDVSGEYEDAATIAEATAKPVREILHRAEAAARRVYEGEYD